MQDMRYKYKKTHQKFLKYFNIYYICIVLYTVANCLVTARSEAVCDKITIFVSLEIIFFLTHMYFSDYKKHKNCKLRDSLFWEYDMRNFNPKEHGLLVVQRVIERGRKDDYYAMFNIFGIRGVRNLVKQIAYLNAKDMNFVCVLFNLKQEDLKCYTRKQLRQQHWNS